MLPLINCLDEISYEYDYILRECVECQMINFLLWVTGLDAKPLARIKSVHLPTFLRFIFLWLAHDLHATASSGMVWHFSFLAAYYP